MGRGISETAFASQVEDLLKLYGWRWCHFRPALTGAGWRTAMTGYKGITDYIAVRPPRLIFAELKDEVKPTTPEQEAWLEDLRECQKVIVGEALTVDRRAKVASLSLTSVLPIITIPEVYLWRPSDFDKVVEVLRY